MEKSGAWRSEDAGKTKEGGAATGEDRVGTPTDGEATAGENGGGNKKT